METPTIKVPPEDRFNIQPELKKNGRIYQFRAFAEHPRLRVYGEVLQVDF